MDWTKLFDKFFWVIASLVPGAVLVMVGVLRHPAAWNDFWALNYLGYQTKLSILLVVCFVAGSTVNSVLGAIVGGTASGLITYRQEKARERAELQRQQAAEQERLANANTSQSAPQAAQQPQAPAQPQPVSPWQDINWRNLVAAYLGDAAPENLQPFLDEAEYQQAVALARSLPQPEQARELSEIGRRASGIQLQRNDALWSEYWNQLQPIALSRHDPKMDMAMLLLGAFGGASLIILLAAPVTPALRHLWILLPCAFYVLVMFGQTVRSYQEYLDPVQTFAKQVQYLVTHVGKGVQPED